MAIESSSDGHPAIDRALIVKRETFLWLCVTLLSFVRNNRVTIDANTNLRKPIEGLNESDVRLQRCPYHLEYSGKGDGKPRRAVRDDSRRCKANNWDRGQNEEQHRYKRYAKFQLQHERMWTLVIAFRRRLVVPIELTLPDGRLVQDISSIL